MAGYMTSAVVSAHLDALATANPAVCTRSGPSDWDPGTQGGKSGYVKVAAVSSDSPAHRWGVLLIGGVHARELAPPDALVSFLEKMLAAYAAHADISYPDWTDPADGTVYDHFVIPWPWVRTVVERLDLYVAPLVNDDGRDFVLAPLPSTATHDVQELHKNWRKNRRPAPSGVTAPEGAGVDINRNFDILWDFKTAYDMSLSDVDVRSSTNPVDDTFVGSGAESEPEARNVAKLMRGKNISFFIDFHMTGRDVMFSWGIESNQDTDATMSFTNRGKDHQRDGIHHGGYKEYIPTATAKSVEGMAKHISGQILAKAGGSNATARTRSTYTVKQSANLYVTSGASDDFCFSRWFAPFSGGAATSPVMAFTVEIGGDPRLGAGFDEGGFSPDYVRQYPKLEREIHVAAWAFLTAAAAANFVAPVAPSKPPAPPSTGAGSSCLMLLVTCILVLGSVLAIVLGAELAGGLLGGGALAAWLTRRRS